MTAHRWLGLRTGAWKQRRREANVLIGAAVALAHHRGMGPLMPLAVLWTLETYLEQERPGRFLPYIRSQEWPGLAAWDDEAAQQWTGWRWSELDELMRVLGTAGRYLRFKHTSKCSLETAVLVFLVRHHSPSPWGHLEQAFVLDDGTKAMDQRRLSMINSAVTAALVAYSEPRLSGSLSWISDEMMARYIQAVRDKAERVLAADDDPLTAQTVRDFIAPKPVWGWIDCTRRPIMKPSPKRNGPPNLADRFYSGYKRAHCVLYQCVGTPDGLAVLLSLPMVGRHHDLSCYHQEDIEGHLQARFSAWPTPYPKVIGDPAYRHLSTPFVVTPIANLHLIPPSSPAYPVSSLANRVFSACRVAVEWNFNMILQKFARFQAHPMKIFERLDLQAYRAACFLTNCYNCASRGNLISQSYELEPPELSMYCQGLQWSDQHVH